MTSWIVENTWTCSACSTSNLGRFLSCQQCGRAKGKDEEASEIVDPTAVVTDPERLKEAKAGANWVCAYCAGTARKGNICANCGSKTAESDPPSRSPRMRAAAVIAKHSPSTRPGPQVTGQGLVDAAQATKFWLHVVSFGLLAFGFIAGLWFLLTPHEFQARVASMKWVHMARYEERTVQHTEGWGTPIGAFNSMCDSRYYGTESCHPYQCNPHQDSYNCNSYRCNCTTTQHCHSLKNGYSSCSNSTSCSTCYRTCYRTVYSTCYEQCPVYRSWCSYDYYAWQPRGDRTITGQSATSMTWPDLGPIDETHRLIKTPAYVVNFTADGETYTYTPDTADDFAQYADGQTWTCEKRVVGLFKPLRRKP